MSPRAQDEVRLKAGPRDSEVADRSAGPSFRRTRSWDRSLSWLVVATEATFT